MALAIVESLDQEIEVQVVHIAPKADTLGGDVVNSVFIEFAEQLLLF